MRISDWSSDVCSSDLWEISLHSDGTTAAGREMIGLGGALPIIPTSGVYGGIDRGTHALWRTSTYDAQTDFTAQGIAGWDSTTARAIIERVPALRPQDRTSVACGKRVSVSVDTGGG